MQINRKMKTNGGDEIVAELEFDEERALTYLANKAWRNRTKKTKLGFCKVTVRPTQAALEKRKQAALAAINEHVAEELCYCNAEPKPHAPHRATGKWTGQ